jgi:hypothetical protein
VLLAIELDPGSKSHLQRLQFYDQTLLSRGHCLPRGVVCFLNRLLPGGGERAGVMGGAGSGQAAQVMLAECVVFDESGSSTAWRGRGPEVARSFGSADFCDYAHEQTHVVRCDSLE